MQMIDRPVTPQLIEATEEAVNAYLRQKEGTAIYGGRYAFDREKNQAMTIMGGRVHYRLDLCPVSVGELITTGSYVDLDFAKAALGLAA